MCCMLISRRASSGWKASLWLLAAEHLRNPFVPTESYLKYTHKDEKIALFGLGPSTGLHLTSAGALLLPVSFPSSFLEQTKIDAAALIL